MPRVRRDLAIAALLLLAAISPARAQTPAEEIALLRKQMAELAQRLEEVELEQSRAAPPVQAGRDAPAPRLGGSATLTSFNGAGGSVFGESRFDVWDARLFVDAELARDARLGEQPLFSDATLSFEWDLVRLGDLHNDVGDLYVDFRALTGRPWLNAQVGRFQIPVGENYKRFGKGTRENPFVTNTTGGTWWWDEGLRLFGQEADGRYGYVASLTDGEGFFNGGGGDADKQTTLKLWARPIEQFYFSLSGLHSGEIGTASSEGVGALWFGETWPRYIGDGSPVTTPIFQHGASVSPGPEEFHAVTLVGADVIANPAPHVRLWLGAGNADLDAEDSHAYDRRLRYWISELVLEGGMLSRSLAPFYLALRANGLGTYDRDKGYLLDFRYGSSVGYNMQSLTAYSIGAGWHLTEDITLKAEYTLTDIGLVSGVTSAIRDAAERSDFFAAALGVDF
jgi:hypothetical protein